MNEVWAKVTGPWRGAHPKVDADRGDVLADELLLAIALDQAALADTLAAKGDYLHTHRLLSRRKRRTRALPLRHADGDADVAERKLRRDENKRTKLLPAFFCITCPPLPGTQVRFQYERESIASAEH